MSRETWNLIKHSKRFYVKTFRSVGSALVISLAINVILDLAIYYCYFRQPEPDYYATYGETAPVPLVAMSEPNYTSVPLLANDSGNDSEVRTLPR